MQKYLDKKAKSRGERVVAPIPARRNSSDVPDLELDLSPLAAYIRPVWAMDELLESGLAIGVRLELAYTAIGVRLEFGELPVFCAARADLSTDWRIPAWQPLQETV